VGKIVNKAALSEIIGVSERTLTDWQRDGLPVVYSGERGESNQYDTEQVIAWMIAREIAKIQAESQKDRLARLQGDKVELEIAEKRGQLIPVEQIEPAWTAMVASARSFLRSQPDRLAHLLEVTDGVDAKRDLIAEAFDDALLKLSEYEPADSAVGEGN
jgi:phage terminase Nu1 subunit (DNA packaging protein)